MVTEHIVSDAGSPPGGVGDAGEFVLGVVLVGGRVARGVGDPHQPIRIAILK